MKLKEEAIRYLTKAEMEAAREDEHRERVALQQRVARGEITAAEANREASIFHPEVFNPATAQTVNYREVVNNLLKLKARKSNGRRGKQTIRA
jgi:hypothetical protein